MKLRSIIHRLLGKLWLVAVFAWAFIPEIHHTADAPTVVPAMLKNPGWYLQWRMKKQDENGEIPQGLYATWLRLEMEKSLKRTETTGLFNIKELGPNNIGGRTLDLLYDMSTPGKIWAATHSGGLWVSKNNGVVWKPINDWASNLTVTSLAQNPFATNEMYYGTGIASGGIGVPGEGIFKSVDGGISFQSLPNSLVLGNIWDMAHSLWDDSLLYVATSSKGLWRTTTKGDTFEQIIPGGNVSDIELLPDGSVVVAIVDQGIYRSHNGEPGSFVEQEKGLPSSGFNRIALALCESHPKVMYAIYTQNIDYENGKTIGVWKSGNGGKTWAYQGNPSEKTKASFAQPWFTLALGVDPADSNKLVAGCRDFVFSLDGGKTWKQGNNGHADHHVYAFRPDKPGYFMLGCDGGVYEYNWETVAMRYVDKNNQFNVTQFYAGSFMPDSLGNIAGAQDNGTAYSIDGRPKYYESMGGDGAFCHIHQQIPTIAYLSYQNGAIRKTNRIDYPVPQTISVINELDGDNNGEIDDGAWFINPFEMNYLNGEMLFYPTRRRLWFSFDGAGSWYPLSTYKSNLYAVGIPNQAEPYRVYFGGDNLLLYRIDDLYGSSPGDEVNLRRNLPSGLMGGFISNITVHPRNDGIIYLSLSNYSNQGRVWRVEDADTDLPKWIDLTGDLPTQLPANWIVVDPYQPDDYLIIGTDFGLYVSQDGGQHWLKEKRVPNVVVEQLRLRYTDRKLFVFTHGRGVFAANLPAMDDPFAGVEQAGSQAESPSLYPNPTTGLVHLAHITGKQSYRITDPQGREVLAGHTHGQLDLSGLPDGNYLVEIQANDRKWTKRVTKVGR
jgi:photosystem II stability/assembly factor-like uncharacterized protein